MVFGGQIASAATVTFDDAYASLGDLGNPATYYSSEGLTISGTYLGVIGGIGHGDPGGWGLEGTNGSVFLGCNDGDSCSPTFNFSSSVDDVSVDIGLANDWSATFTVTGYLGGGSTILHHYGHRHARWHLGYILSHRKRRSSRDQQRFRITWVRLRHR